MVGYSSFAYSSITRSMIAREKSSVKVPKRALLLSFLSLLIINFATCDFWTLVKKPVLLIDT